MATTGRGRIEISGEDCRQIVRKIRKLLQDQFGTFHLNGTLKVEVCRHTDYLAVSFGEHSDGALARPATLFETAGDVWSRAQKKMLMVVAFPCLLIEDDVVLPGWRRRASLPDKIIGGQQLIQKVDLEIICFLQGDKVRTVLGKKVGKAMLPVIPAIRPVICQSEPQIQRHNRKHDRVHSLRHS